MPLFAVALAALVAADEPRIHVARESDHYRVSVDFFRWSSSEAVNAAVQEKMKSACGIRAVQQLESDFQSADPGAAPEGEPPLERAVWNFWATFKCVEPSAFAPEN